MLAPKKCLGHLGTDKEHEFVPTRPNQLRCRPGCGRADLRKGDRHKPGTGDRRKDRRDRHKNKGDRHTNAIKTPKLERPFIAVDGEGAGTNEHGQQNYLLMRARGLDDSTRRSLFKDNRPLTSAECLEFILSLPRDAELVGFGIGYDVTMILRDLPPEKLRRLLKGQLHIDEDDQAEYRPPGRGLYSYTYWKDYAIMYVPEQFFRVARLCYNTKEHKQKVVERSSRCINEVRHSFQMPFAKVIDFWEVGDPETREMISRNKEKRAEFDAVTPEIQRYCEEECRLLAEVMTLFRAACIEAGARSGISLIPRNWRGAGGYSAAMHKSCGTPRKEQVKDSRPPEVEALAIEAFYGGRFEIPRTGLLPGPIFEYDIGSAHPAAMLQLPVPCIRSGTASSRINREASSDHRRTRCTSPRSASIILLEISSGAGSRSATKTDEFTFRCADLACIGRPKPRPPFKSSAPPSISKPSGSLRSAATARSMRGCGRCLKFEKSWAKGPRDTALS